MNGRPTKLSVTQLSRLRGFLRALTDIAGDHFDTNCAVWTQDLKLSLLDDRSAGTVSWAGIFNTYYWLDPAKRVTGLIMTQILPFADQRVLKLYGQFESAVYETLKTA